MKPEFTEQEIRECAEIMHKRYGRPVTFYEALLKEDAWKASRAFVAKNLPRLQTSVASVPATAAA